MDKPLKYFLITTVIFTSLIAVFLIASLKKMDVENKELPVLDPEDPLLILAKSKAQFTMDTLFHYYPRYPNNSFVRFAFEAEKGSSEHIWARITEINEDRITVTAEDDDDRFAGELELSKGEAEDWLIEISQNKVMGGFTTQVLLIREKEEIPTDSARIDSLLGLFVYPVN